MPVRALISAILSPASPNILAAAIIGVTIPAPAANIFVPMALMPAPKVLSRAAAWLSPRTRGLLSAKTSTKARPARIAPEPPGI